MRTFRGGHTSRHLRNGEVKDLVVKDNLCSRYRYFRVGGGKGEGTQISLGSTLCETRKHIVRTHTRALFYGEQTYTNALIFFSLPSCGIKRNDFVFQKQFR